MLFIPPSRPLVLFLAKRLAQDGAPGAPVGARVVVQAFEPQQRRHHLPEGQAAPGGSERQHGRWGRGWVGVDPAQEEEEQNLQDEKDVVMMKSSKTSKQKYITQFLDPKRSSHACL